MSRRLGGIGVDCACEKNVSLVAGSGGPGSRSEHEISDCDTVSLVRNQDLGQRLFQPRSHTKQGYGFRYYEPTGYGLGRPRAPWRNPRSGRFTVVLVLQT